MRHLLALIALLAVTSLGGWTGATAAAADPTAVVHHDTNLRNAITFNLCGGGEAPCDNDGDQSPAANLFSYVMNGPSLPRSIATQETCIQQWLFLQGWLELNGYQSARQITDDHPTSTCDQHGNAIFWKGNCPPGCRIDVRYTAQSPVEFNPPLRLGRGFICGVSTSPGFITCSTHLSNKDPIKAFQQSGEYSSTMNFWNSTFVLAAGDFNLVPPVVAGFYGNYWESDSCELSCTNLPTWFKWGSLTGPFEKFDYVFTNRCRLHDLHLQASIESDHRIVKAYMDSCSGY